jgi:hypothetical protein
MQGCLTMKDERSIYLISLLVRHPCPNNVRKKFESSFMSTNCGPVSKYIKENRQANMFCLSLSVILTGLVKHTNLQQKPHIMNQ